jgi:hypothetical protein
MGFVADGADRDRKRSLRPGGQVTWVRREPCREVRKVDEHRSSKSGATNNLHCDRKRTVLRHRRGRAGGRHRRHANTEIRLKDERCVGGRCDGAGRVTPCQNQGEGCGPVDAGGRCGGCKYRKAYSRHRTGGVGRKLDSDRLISDLTLTAKVNRSSESARGRDCERSVDRPTYSDVRAEQL